MSLARDHTSPGVFSSPAAEVDTDGGGGSCIKIEGKVINPNTAGTCEHLASSRGAASDQCLE